MTDDNSVLVVQDYWDYNIMIYNIDIDNYYL